MVSHHCARVQEVFLMIQADNPASTNKNNGVLECCGWLVENHIVDHIDISFMVTGHMHDFMDQAFSILTQAKHCKTVWTIPHYVQLFHDLQGRHPNQVCLRQWYFPPIHLILPHLLHPFSSNPPCHLSQTKY